MSFTNKINYGFNNNEFGRRSHNTRLFKEEAFQKLKENAINLKVNAVVGICIDVETNPTSVLIIVSITGTAVKIL
ncbi:heavy metal-binding domain-containing protein [Flavivirga jejuensis]|uniref:Heavy metal-binding domain-containing protein n=1 Tax=Flavivirga jejuensis TaxID=870487 RepID=A0ABT8WQU2_9FLAO|nr:heavy metal-binding domain-containing protein [Flavivirga jejuensis]MDO5975369.1 heavy metal-binding domain-containing protein [Flavivirga jejuensis]